jgi:hypothetical protein
MDPVTPYLSYNFVIFIPVPITSGAKDKLDDRYLLWHDQLYVK